MIRAKNITKSFGSLQVLKGISLEVSKSEVISIMGASGAGKSTLLHILGTLSRPDSGSLEIDGTDVLKLSGNALSAFRNKKIGFVFQAHHLLPEFTSLENVMIPALIGGTCQKEARSTALALLSELGLAQRISHKPSELSGGEQQRVAIARALAKNPKLMLCDEPTGALDYQTGKQVLKLLQDTCRKSGMTVIIITHNSALAPMADRVVHVKNGTVASVELNEKPIPIEEIEW